MGVLKQAGHNLAKFHLSPNRHAKVDRRQVSHDFSSKKKFFESISEHGPELANNFNSPSVFSVPEKQRTQRNSEKIDEGSAVQNKNKRDEGLAAQNKKVADSKDSLLARMAAKQARLAELQEQQQLVEFEILEIQAQLQDFFPNQKTDQVEPSKPDFSGLRKTTSLFFDHSSNELRKTVSTFFQASPLTKSQPSQPSQATVQATAEGHHKTSIHQTSSKANQTCSKTKPDLRHQASVFFAKTLLPNPELKNKASMMLNTTLNEVKEKLDQQQTELETFTRKGTDLAREFLTSLSPKKPGSHLNPSNAADSSFMVENLSSGKEASILLSDDESYGEGHGILATLGAQPSVLECSEILSGSSIIDIDDYESSDDERY